MPSAPPMPGSFRGADLRARRSSAGTFGRPRTLESAQSSRFELKGSRDENTENTRLHPDRDAGCVHDHRGSDRAPVAGGASSARVGPPRAMRQQPQTALLGHRELRRRSWVATAVSRPVNERTRRARPLRDEAPSHGLHGANGGLQFDQLFHEGTRSREFHGLGHGSCFLALPFWHAPQFLVQRGWEFSLKTDHVVNNELFDLAFPLLSSQPALNSFGVR